MDKYNFKSIVNSIFNFFFIKKTYYTEKYDIGNFFLILQSVFIGMIGWLIFNKLHLENNIIFAIVCFTYVFFVIGFLRRLHYEDLFTFTISVSGLIYAFDSIYSSKILVIFLIVFYLQILILKLVCDIFINGEKK